MSDSSSKILNEIVGKNVTNTVDTLDINVNANVVNENAIIENENFEYSLPENAFKELQEGEEYIPPMKPNRKYREVTPWSVFWGLFMAILFSAAAAYSGLKVGQVMETGIPIAILAVGLSSFLRNNDKLGQNVIIQSIGASSGGVVAGAVFIMPALYILGFEPSFLKMFLATLIGGCLGILFIIPFRKYFVKEMHGKLPFPEATATTEILSTGNKGGQQAWLLVFSALVGGINDFIASSVGWWSDTVSSKVLPLGDVLVNKFRLVFKMSELTMILGLGYIIGLRFSLIICIGSFISWFVFVPLIFDIGQHLTVPFGNVTQLISTMSAEEIFRNYVRHIGIGGIAMAGLIGIWRSKGIIVNAIKLTGESIFKKNVANAHLEEHEPRTQRDISMPFVVLFLLLTILLAFLFFFGVVDYNLKVALIGIALTFVISFLFTTVAANGIALVGNNPVSGMTLMTLILTSVVLSRIGFAGNSGMVSALIIGGVVATSLAMAGTFISDLKVGYWLGTTPKKQETWKFVGTFVSAMTTVAVMYILNKAYGFSGPNALVAPQANAMAAIIQPLMQNIDIPWMLYLVGAFLAILMSWLGVSPLAFALGMYLPQDLNTPLLLGGALAWFVSTRSKDKDLNEMRKSRGMLIASGFIAGGAIFGVFGALLRFFDIDLLNATWQAKPVAELLSVCALFAVVGYFLFSVLKTNKNKESA